MKRVVGILLPVLMLLASCGKKTRPTTSVPAKKNNTPAAVTPAVKDTPAPTTALIPDTPAAVPAAAMAPMIVIDEKGRVITEKNRLPEEVAAKVNYSKITRGFTPAQRQNLIYRFKMVPPRVLYVPDQLSSRNGKGTYVVYKKKFWYWRKDDGLFHLDETYYQ